MNKSLGIVFLAVGACVLIYGFSAADSVASDFSRFFNGTPTNRSIMLLMLGSVLSLFGVSQLSKEKSS